MYDNILKVRDTCAKCRGCCNSVKLPFRKDSKAGELLLEKFQNDELPEGHEIREDKSRPEFWIYDSNKEPCMFLEYETYTCTIHNIKPILCKTYPLKWYNQHHYYIDLCALAFVVPLKEIYSWKDGHEEEIKCAINYVNPHSPSEWNNLEYLIPISRVFYERENVKSVLYSDDEI